MVPLSGDEVFKHMSLWKIFHIQILAVSKSTSALPSKMLTEKNISLSRIFFEDKEAQKSLPSLYKRQRRMERSSVVCFVATLFINTYYAKGDSVCVIHNSSQVILCNSLSHYCSDVIIIEFSQNYRSQNKRMNAFLYNIDSNLKASRHMTLV